MVNGWKRVQLLVKELQQQQHFKQELEQQQKQDNFEQHAIKLEQETQTILRLRNHRLSIQSLPTAFCVRSWTRITWRALQFRVCSLSLTTFITGGQRSQHPTSAGLPLQEVQQDDEQGLEEEVCHLVRRREDNLPSEPARLHGECAWKGNPIAVCHCQSSWSSTGGCAQVTTLRFYWRWCCLNLNLNRPVPLMGSAGVSSNGGLSNGVTGSKGEVIFCPFKCSQ